MCTSIVVNKKKTIVGWNLDLLDMEYRVRPAEEGVYIEVNDAKEGWMPLFGANSRGDFVGMPTCWPADRRSDPAGDGENVILLDIDLLLQKKTLQEICESTSLNAELVERLYNREIGWCVWISKSFRYESPYSVTGTVKRTGS